MNSIQEEEKTPGETVATSIEKAASAENKPMAIKERATSLPSSEPPRASIRVSTASAQSTMTNRMSTLSAGARYSLAGLDPKAVQKALKSELQHWKDKCHNQQREMQHRIDTLETENADLLQEQDILNDRHHSHTEELRYMQNEFLCIKGHLQKLRNDMESLDGLLIEQQLKQNEKKMTREEHQLAEKVEEAIFKVKERQEFTCVFMENTIASIDEILNEYIPEKVEYKVVEDHKTIEELEIEAKLREMKEEEELRQRREIEKQLALQQEQEIMERENGQGSEFAEDSSDFGMSIASLPVVTMADEQLSELGIETPAMREAKLFQETQTLFKEQQEMFAKYLEECRSDEAVGETSLERRFKGWFEEKRDKWLDEEKMKELRQKKRQSQAVMMHKVKQMHTDTFQKVTDIKLNHFEQEEHEKDRKEQRAHLLKLGGIVEEGSFRLPGRDPSPQPPPKPKEEQVMEKLQEDLRFSLTKGDLNDFFKTYKDSHSALMDGGNNGGGGGRSTPSRQESRGILGIFGFGQAEAESC